MKAERTSHQRADFVKKSSPRRKHILDTRTYIFIAALQIAPKRIKKRVGREREKEREREREREREIMRED